MVLALSLAAAACGDDDDDAGAGGGGDVEVAGDGEGDDGASEPAAEDSDGSDATGGDDTETEPAGDDPAVGRIGDTLGFIRHAHCEASNIPQGGTLTVGLFGEVVGLDPAIVQGGGSLGAAQMTALYDSLFYQNLEDGALLPGTAVSIEPDDDATVWTLTLREGVTFTDGTPYDAEAFAYNVEYHQNDETSSAKAQADLIVDLVIIDDLTIEMTLAGPNATFPNIFADKMAWIFSPTAQQELGEQFNVRPVGAGAGPFVFKSWTQDSEMVFERNPDYWNAPCPYLDEIIFKPIPADDQRLNAYNNGDLDTMYTRVAADFQAMRRDGRNVAGNIQNLGGFTMFNNAAEPFNIFECRAAVVYATDLDAINNSVYNGASVMDRAVFKADSPWYDASLEDMIPQFDLARAEEFLAACEEELGGPLEFEYRCHVAPENALLGEVLVALWNRAGISATQNCTEVGDMVSQVFAGAFQATAWATPISDDPDPSLFQSFFGDSTVEGECGEGRSNRNWHGFCHPDIDDALVRGRENTDPEVRFQAYSDFQRLFYEHLPLNVFTKTEQGYFFADDVANMQFGTDGQLLLAFVGKTG